MVGAPPRRIQGLTGVAAEAPTTQAVAPRLAAVITLAGAAACWAVLVSQAGAMGGMMGTGALLAFIGTWVFMMAAMMLPSAVPVIRRYSALPGRNLWLVDTVLLVTAYLAVWSVVGVAAYLIYVGLRMPWPSQVRVLGAAVVLAGLYSLTPQQRRFAAVCRATCDGAGLRSARGSVTKGIAYGLNCIGCSGAAMVVMLVAGMSSLIWMAIVAAFVLVYKAGPHGRRLDATMAVVVVTAGLWLTAYPDSMPIVLMPSTIT
jgi:predicted metal-binding membrane protein